MAKSNVNKKVFSIPPAILMTGRVLQFFSPRLAARFALKLFRTPFPFKRPDREMNLYESAVKSFVDIPGIKKKIRVFSFGDSGKKVLLVHGWAGRGTQMFKLAETLVSENYTVVSFDGPSHGDSEGKQTAMTEFISTVLELDKKFGPFEVAMGHSLGGMTVLAALNQGLSVQKAVVMGGGDSIYKITHRFIKRLGMKETTAEHLFYLMEKELSLDPESLSASAQAPRINIPVLIIHDRDDSDVPLFCAEHVASQLPQSELMITQGLGHRRILQDEDVIRRILTFIKS